MGVSRRTGMNAPGLVTFEDGVHNGERATVAVGSIEMNIRRGNQFIWTWDNESIPNNSTMYAGFVVGPTHSVIIKTRNLSTDGGVVYKAHSDSVFTFNPANEIPNKNLNGNSAEVSDLKVYELTAGEITDIGTVLPGGITRSAGGQGNNREQGIFSDVGIERILPPNSRNVISIENLDNQAVYVVLDITWYEGIITPGADNPV